MKKYALASLAIIGITGVAAQHYYAYQWRPNALLHQLNRRFAHAGKLSGGWINHKPVSAVRGDVYCAAYNGGIILDGQPYAFVVAIDGTVLRFAQV